MKIEEILAKNLREIRSKRGLTQEAVAGRADLQANYYACIERAEKVPSLETLAVLAKALKIEPYKLLKPEGYKEE